MNEKMPSGGENLGHFGQTQMAVKGRRPILPLRKIEAINGGHGELDRRPPGGNMNGAPVTVSLEGVAMT